MKQKSPSEASKHKKSLEELKDKDPEFYEFLRKEDSGLLDFDESDDGEYTESGSDDSDDGAHRHPEKLEVSTDYGTHFAASVVFKCASVHREASARPWENIWLE